MKNTGLLIAIALASQYSIAQMQPMPAPQSDPPAASGATDISGTSGPSSDASSGDSTSGASNGMRSEAGADLQPAPSPVARLQPVTQGDITYICGGVGEEEAALMKTQARKHDMMLTFATRRGEYLADVNVEIADAKGNTMLQANCDSPLMLVDLPHSGTYRVRAETAGYAMNQTVKVANVKSKAHVASAILSWPERVAKGSEAETATGSGGAGTSESGKR